MLLVSCLQLGLVGAHSGRPPWVGDPVSGVMAVGWKQIDKSWYYFNQAGHMITGWLNDGGRYYYLNPADGKMIVNGSFVVNNVNYTFNQSGVCLSETSAIDGGSAGRVYTPGTGGTVANGNYMGGACQPLYENAGGCYRGI